MTKYRHDYRIILLTALVTCTGLRDAAAAGDIFNLGTLGGTTSYGTGINDSGQVTGQANTTGGNVHPFLYTGTPGAGGAMADLGTLGGTFSEGNGINNAGQVAGQSGTTGGATHAFRYTGTPGSGGAMADLGTLGGTTSGGFGINDAGQVAGVSDVDNISFHAFRTAPNAVINPVTDDLGTLGGEGSVGFGINAAGQVAGYAFTTETPLAVHAFRYTGTPGSGGAMADLGTLGGTSSIGRAINNAGQVAGHSQTTGNAADHAFRYTGTPGSGGAMVDLGTLGGTNSYGNAINDAGFVVGAADRSANAGGGSWATLWQTDAANTAVDLDAWLDATNPTLGAYWVLDFAYGINDDGLITGAGVYDDGPGGLSDGTRAFILDASGLVPEPSSLALLVLGATALAVHRSRGITDLLCLCCALLVTSAAHAAQYTVTDLGVFGEPFSNSVGTGINASGQVSGSSYTTGYTEFQAFLWTPTTPNGASGTRIELGTLGGSSGSGFGINASGQVAGLSFTTGDAADRAFLWKPTMPGGASGTMHDLGTLGGNWSNGFGINDSGQVTGYSGTTEDSVAHAFMWKPTTPGGTSGTMHDLGTLGETYSEGHDINASGQVAGYSFVTEDAAHAFMWKPTTPGGTIGTIHDLGTLGGTYSGGAGINDSGQVAGFSTLTGDTADHAILWTPTTPGGTSGTMLDLGTLGGTYSAGEGINDNGQVVGGSLTAGDASYHAFLYTSGSGMVDLNTLIDPLSGWELSGATDINDAGQITGQGFIDGEYHAFLLTPALPGDFDFDSDVDGLDFLKWQRGESPDPLSSADLADWEINYGTDPAPLAAATTSVPEPTSGLLAATALGLCLARRRHFHPPN